MIGLEKQRDTIKAEAFLRASGETAKEREKKADCHKSVREWLQKYEDAVYDYEIYKNRRAREVLVVECWRSENANRRKGNV